MRRSEPGALKGRHRVWRILGWIGWLAIAWPLFAPQQPVAAGNALRHSGSGPSSPEAAATEAAAQAAQAAQLAQQSQGPLRLALDAIKNSKAQQSAASAAAQGQGSVPDGLAPGGLQLAQDAPVNAMAPTQSTAGGRTEVTVTQTAQRAVLTWNSFNVGSLTDLYFDQAAGGSNAASWVMLNRVTGGTPSTVLGSIKAEGQVYLINQNGILFGGASQVNVGTLVLSGLDLLASTPANTVQDRNQLFLNSATALQNLTFASAPSGAGTVTVEDGANLQASSGGRVVLLGTSVTNNGSIAAPSGQVFLAAGSTVALQGDTDPTVRGLSLNLATSSIGTGVVVNSGLISAPLGNITMVGGETVQNGLLTATTGAQVNGVIYLGANGYITSFGPGSVTQVLPDTGGAPVVGSGSSFSNSFIQVTGDKIYVQDGATLYAPAGNITLSAAMTVPPAISDPTSPGYDPTLADDTRVYIGSGARIDVSGLTDVQVAMSQNSIQAQLTANTLRDNPVLQASTLHDQTVYFDLREGTALTNGTGVADLSGYLDLLQRSVPQLMTNGGTVTLQANTVIARQGSTIDLSGGSLQYQPGYVRSTVLIDANGNRVPIEQAQPGVDYVGLSGDYVANHPRWGVTQTYSSALGGTSPVFEAGYEQGGNAGTLSIGTSTTGWYNAAYPSGAQLPAPPNPSATGAVRILDGSIVATTTVGPYQRGLPTGTSDPTQIWKVQPKGATLNLDQSGDVTFSQNVAPVLGADFGPESPIPASLWYAPLTLPTAWFNGSTFKDLAIVSGTDPEYLSPPGSTPVLGTDERAPGGHLTLPAGTVVDLGDGGSFSFSGKAADLEGTILAPGGTVSLSALQREGTSAQSARIDLGASGVIDVAGRFSNDDLDGAGEPLRALNGGTVSLTAPQVVLEAGSVVDVSGGAHLSADGKTLSAGSGGAIKLDVSQYPTPAGDPTQLSQPFSGTLIQDGALRGYALAPGLGGSLTVVTGSEVTVGDSGAGPYVFSPSYFTRGGFSSYALVGGLGLTVAANTVVAPSAQAFVLETPAAAEVETGTRLYDVATLEVPSQAYASPMSLSLSTAYHLPAGGLATPYNLTVEPGAAIEMLPGSKVQLSSEAGGSVVVGGVDASGPPVPTKIEAPGGTLSLSAGEVDLEQGAALLAPGYTKSAVQGNFVVRSVLPGGTITVSATSTVDIAPGAVLDASGVSGTADLLSGGRSATPYQPVTVDGAAGAIAITAPQGVVSGTFRLGNGPGATTGSSLSVSTNGNPLSVTGSAAPQEANGVLTVAAGSLDASGAEDIALSVISPEPQFTNQNAIQFSGDLALAAGRSLSLVAPILGLDPTTPDAQVTLRAPYVSLGEPFTPSPVSLGGAASVSGRLDVQATQSLIDVSGVLVLTGTSSYGGFASTRFTSPGEVRLSDPSGNLGSPGLFSAGSLEFDCAQLYVASREQAGTGTSLERPSDDPGFLVEAGTTLVVKGNGQPAQAPLSFGERLTLDAPEIDQGGVVRAPQGQVILGGADTTSVTLEPGSLTSASLEGATVPFGPVLAGGLFGQGANGYGLAGQAPTKSVTIDAPSVNVKKGATIDVSGGGDLLGYLFTPGNGGSKDILDPSYGVTGYAILPSLGSQPAPLGGTPALTDSRLAVGESVYLQGVPGLANGFYTLLPAHDALLPGGYLVEPMQGSYAAPAASYTRPDGAVVSSGYATFGATAIPGPVWNSYVVMPQSVFTKYSQLDTYSFDGVAASLASQAGATVRVPNDAGAVVLSAENLVLEGTGRFQPGPGGLLGDLDISAGKIAVVGNGATAPDPSYLALDLAQLEAFGAGSILLGGIRTATAAGTEVTVNATQVVVDTNGATFTAPEIILAAQADPNAPSPYPAVWITGGSSLAAQSPAGSGANLGLDGSTLLLDSDGALVRLSAGQRVGIANSSTGATGILQIDGASLAAAGSLTLAGSGNIVLGVSALLSSPQLDLASTVVNLGAAPAGTPGTTLGSATVAKLASSSDLLIRGYQAIEVFGDLAIGQRDPSSGQASLAKLTLDTPLLQGEGNADGTAGSASITAGVLTLRNTGGTATAAAGQGDLHLDVDTLDLGPGEVALAGYATLSGRAGAIEAEGAGGVSFGGSLSLATAQLRAGSGASYTIEVDGSVQLLSGPGLPEDPKKVGLGGTLAIASNSAVTLDTAVLVPAGTFAVTAGSGALHLGPNARVDVSGRAVEFSSDPEEPVTRFAPGGFIRLTAVAGDLDIDPQATLEVASGSPQGGDAGDIALTAGPQSTASVEGILLGAAGSGANRGGSFALDAGQVSDFGFLGALASGGFDQAVSLHLRGNQGITVASGQTLAAHEVVLRSDGGPVIVAGTVDAAGTALRPDGGSIELGGYAAPGQVGVLVSGTLDAHAGAAVQGGFAPESPQVEMVATGGSLTLAQGSLVDLRGGTDATGAALPGGALVLRAPRVGNDVALSPIAGTVRGASAIVVQGVDTETTDASGDADALVPGALASATAWLGNAPTILARLASADPSLASELSIGAGIVLENPAGDLTLADSVDLHGQLGPGYFGLVASGNVAIGNGTAMTLSDGFAAAAPGQTLGYELLGTPSASLGFEAGGDVALASNAVVRTGTGSISILAGRDVVLAPSAVLYSAGLATTPPPSFTGRTADAAGQTLYFPAQGGDISIEAGRNITSQLSPESTSAWLFRYGDASGQSAQPEPTSWSILYQNFEQGLGALGGGNVTVAAGGDIQELQVSIPTTGYLKTPAGMTPVASDLVVQGGGNLNLLAGGNLYGGLFVLGLGEATVRAGGGVLPTGESDLANPQTLLYYRGSAGSASPGTTKGGVGVLFGLMDATASVTAASSVTVEGVYDPTMQGQVAANLLGGTGSAFWGYSSRAALSAVSLGGDVHYESDPWASVDLTRATPLSVSMAGAGTSSLNAAFALAPPSLELTSLESNVYLEDHFGGGSALYLAPAPEGTLDLLAQGDLHLALGRIQMEDVYPSLAPGPLDAFALHGDSSGSVAILPNLWTMTGAPLHAGDPEPVHLYAVDGSVCAAHLGACTFTPTVGVQVLVPKPIEVVAGKDIVGGTYQPENNDPNDLSLFMAGRDIDQPVVNVMGEGATLLQAGRDLTLSQESSSGSNATPLGGAVYSLGNETAATVLTNSRSTPFPTDPGLSGSKGSDLYLMAGTANGVAWDAFAQAYLDPSNGQHVAKTYLAELASYLSGLDAAKYGALSPAELLAAFEALPLARRELFLDQVYFSELGQAGLDYNDPSSPGYHSYDRGFRAVSLLFPTDPASLSDAQRGNVVLSGKPVETQVDASIDILAPYGRVDVGAAIVPDSSGNSGGVVTRRGGDINVMADEDISLFTSRVFTLEGGNITMWTSNGSITAGTGSKTSVLQVPLEYTMDEEATLTVQAFGLQTGAGIGVLDALSNAASRPKNELDLIAPRGEVNAGDAGIRVVGDLNIAAEVVVGVENIQFTGNSAGVPKVELPSIGTLTSASQVATQATAATEPTPAEAAAAHKAALEELPSIITVEVVGYETTEAPEGPAGDADRGRKKGPPARP